jgi:hypothetical protein
MPPISWWFLAWFTLQPWRWRRHIHPRRRLTFNELHGAITIAVRTSNPTVAIQHLTCEEPQLSTRMNRHRVCSFQGRDSSVDIASGWTSVVQFPAVERVYCTASRWAHPASYTMDIGSSFPGVNWQWRAASHSPPSNAEVKNWEVIPPLPHTSSWRVA